MIKYYEYGVNDLVTLGYSRTMPFKPNIYDATTERIYLYIDVIRFVFSIIITFGIMIYRVSS